MKYINPNEYGSLLFDEKEKNAILNTFNNEKIFRYASATKSKTDEFENILKKYVGTKYALGVTNGTSGLITALIGCNIQKNDRVLVSSFTFLATALAVKLVGAIPIPMNLDIINGFDLEDAEEEMKKGCKALIVVQLQGRCYDLTNLLKLAKKYKVIVIEDSCQALGAHNKEKYAGTIGDIGVYSFQQFKQISSGEGGAIVTNNKKYYERMRNYSDMGSERNLFPNWNGENVLFGQNYRMNNITAAILCEQMKKIDLMLKQQQKSRDYIMKNINTNRVINSCYPTGDTGMNILFLLDSENDFKLLKNKGNEIGIEVRNMWSGLYFENKLFKDNKLTDIDLKDKDCSNTHNLISRLAVISIPPILTIDNCDSIINFINNNIR